ncbi:MAG: hypothetical protein HQK75_12480, partial [Candidatus Magnetomorum sp.]|nr:hypothetical protein [Candidatus Magnetomorum sp.]
TVIVSSQGSQSINRTATITTSTPILGFDLSKLSNDTQVVPGKTATYSFAITNTSPAGDTYLLNVLGGRFKYEFTNSDDTARIKALSLSSGVSDTFNVNVMVPKTGLANGIQDTITVSVISQGNQSLTNAFQVITTIPAFSFTAQALTNDVMVIPGNAYYFPVDVQNTGTTADTYNIQAKSSNWSYSIRNQSDTASINTLSLGSGSTETFYVKVSVPYTGVSNNQSESIDLTLTSQGNDSVQSDPIHLSITTPLLAANMGPVTSEHLVFPGQSYLYSIEIGNHGDVKDTYDIDVMATNSVFSYGIRNQMNNAAITEISVNPGITETFYVSVAVPYTGINSGDNEEVQVQCTSQTNMSYNKLVGINTTTPTFNLGLTKSTADATIYPGQSYNYEVIITNQSSCAETFDLSVTGTWNYQFRDITDTATISEISIGKGLTAIFLVKVTVPYTGISNGDSDAVTIYAISQGNNQVSKNVQVTTSTPTVSFTAQNFTGDSEINVNQEFTYQFKIENTGSAMDTYNLSVIGGNWSYTIRNFEDYGTINHITVPPQAVETFLVRVKTPPATANGEVDSITVSIVSQGNPSVKEEILTKSAIPIFSHIVTQNTFAKTVNKGLTFNYNYTIKNTGATSDSYDLTILGGSWSYALRNSTDTSDLTNLSIGSGLTEAFIINLTMPSTGIVNGDTDSITIQTTSQSNPGVITHTALATTASDYSFTLNRVQTDATVKVGESYTYVFQVHNAGTPNDTYQISSYSESLEFTHTLRDAGNTNNISILPVNSGQTESFLLIVNVPSENIPNAASDWFQVGVSSMGITSTTIYDFDIVTTSTPDYKVSCETEVYGIFLDLGESATYTINITNIGNVDETYDLSFQNQNFTTSLRNASDSENISTISISQGLSETVLIKVDVSNNAPNGQIDDLSFYVTSKSNPSVVTMTRVTTALKYYQFSMENLSTRRFVPIGSTFSYPYSMTNLGKFSDSYTLTFDCPTWPVVIRNSSDTQTITSLSLASKEAYTFLVNVSIPATATSWTDDSVALTVVSQKNSTVSKSHSFIAEAMYYSHSVTPTPTTAIIEGGSYTNYQLEVKQTGDDDDTYEISVIGGSWSYSLRNSADTKDITDLVVQDDGMGGEGEGEGEEGDGKPSESFIVKVSAPLTAAESAPDTITVRVVSTKDPIKVIDTEIVTHISPYGFSVSSDVSSMTVGSQEPYSYVVSLSNTGTLNDSYTLTYSGDNQFVYELRSLSGTPGITTISVNSLETKQFVLVVDGPGFTNETIETVDVKVQSSNGRTKSITITSTSKTYNFDIGTTSQGEASPGVRHLYIYNIINNASGSDTYTLTIEGGNWEYSISNITTGQIINTIDVDAYTIGYFNVNVVPPTSASYPSFDSATLRVYSHKNSSLSKTRSVYTTIKQPCAQISFYPDPNTSGTIYAAPGQILSFKGNIDIKDSVNSCQHSYEQFSLSAVVDAGSYTFMSGCYALDESQCDTLSINQITVQDLTFSGYANESYRFKYVIPSTGVSHGDTLALTVTIRSLSYPENVFTTSKTISVNMYSNYSFTPGIDISQMMYLQQSLAPGTPEMLSFTIANNNTLSDTYDLTVTKRSSIYADLAWSYTFRNASDSQTITSVSLEPGSSEVIWLRSSIDKAPKMVFVDLNDNSNNQFFQIMSADVWFNGG